MDEATKQNFAYWRARRQTASVALREARADTAKGKRRYGACVPAIGYNPRRDAYGFKACAWIENAADGLRLKGFADEIRKSIGHKGWYTDEDGFNEVLRGIVYQLPARNGEARFVYGYADPNNKGAAYLSFDYETDEDEAARLADRLAERVADEEREYNRAWQAGADYAELGEDVKGARRAILELVAERRKARELAASGFPAICDTLRAEVSRLYSRIVKAREKRAELLDNYGTEAAFKEHVTT